MIVLFGHKRPFSIEIIKLFIQDLKFDFEIWIGVEALGPGSIPGYKITKPSSYYKILSELTPQGFKGHEFLRKKFLWI